MADPCIGGFQAPDVFFGQKLTRRSMGIGKLGGPDIIHKRKNRWLFSIHFCNRSVPPHFVKTSGRPNITIEDTQVDFLNERTWVPGKASWETITVTYIDVSTTTSDNMPLWDWLASVYDFTSNCRWQNSRRQDYAGEGVLALFDGCGNELEVWKMADMLPSAINFGDLDMGSGDMVEIELTLRYSQVQYQNFCGRDVQRCGCTVC